MWQTYANQRLFGAVFVSLVVLAWLALAVWGASPAGYLMDHRAIGDHDLRLDPDYATTFLIFVGGWTLMTVAMMLPTTLPLLIIFRNMTSSRADRLRLLGVLLSGYLLVWSAFGGLAHIGDFFIHQAVESDAWLHSNEWLLGALPLLVAGVYQFTPLKHICLEKCRSPFSFVAERWRGERANASAFRIGVNHGVFCLGCCWSLMLLMFVVSMGNLAWMLALAAVMGVEKNTTWGRSLSTPLGIVLLTTGATIVVVSLI